MTDRPRTRCDAFARAGERGRRLAATILSGPDMLTGEVFAHRLGLTVSDLHDLEQAHAILVLPGVSPREARYPAWQINATGSPSLSCPHFSIRWATTDGPFTAS